MPTFEDGLSSHPDEIATSMTSRALVVPMLQESRQQWPTDRSAVLTTTSTLRFIENLARVAMMTVASAQVFGQRLVVDCQQVRVVKVLGLRKYCSGWLVPPGFGLDNRNW